MEEDGTCANVLSQHILFGVYPCKQLYALEVSCARKDVHEDIVVSSPSSHCPPSKGLHRLVSQSSLLAIMTGSGLTHGQAKSISKNKILLDFAGTNFFFFLKELAFSSEKASGSHLVTIREMANLRIQSVK